MMRPRKYLQLTILLFYSISHHTGLSTETVEKYSIPKISVYSNNSDERKYFQFQVSHYQSSEHATKIILTGTQRNGTGIREARSSGPDIVCKRTGSCDFNKGLYIPACYCDSKCYVFKDCCYDKENVTEVITKFTRKDTVALGNQSNETNFLNLDSFTCRRHMIYSNYGVWTINTCSLSNPIKDQKEKCFRTIENAEDISEIIPVSDKNGNVYYNRYCALCSGVQRFLTWNVRTSFSSTNEECLVWKFLSDNSIHSAVSYANNFLKQCQEFEFLHPSGRVPRFCMLYDRSITECRIYQNPVELGRRRLFKNEDCCNKASENGCTTASWNCKDNSLITEHSIWDIKFTTPRTITVLFQFKSEVENDNSNCLTDLDKGVSCSDFHCFHNKGEQCFNNAVYHGIIWSHTIYFQLDYPHDLDILFRGIDLYFRYIPLGQRTIKLVDKPVIFFFISNSTQNTKLNCNVTYRVATQSPSYIQDIQSPMKWLKNLKIHYIEITEINNRTSRKNITISGYSNICRACASQRGYVIHSERQLLVRGGMLFSRRRLRFPEFAVDTLLKKESCDEIYITVASINQTDNITYKLMNWTCDSLTLPEEPTIESTIEQILTYVFLGLSCACIIFCLPFHIRSNNFKTIPGKNIANIMISICLSQLVFMIGIGSTSNKFACRIIGIVLHYLFLLSFSWLTVSFLYMTHTFSRMISLPGQRTSNSCSRVFNITMIGYFLPAIFVLPPVISEKLNITLLYAGYADNDVCFPTSFPGSLIVFVAPVGLSITVNIFCLLICTNVIREYSMKSEVTKQRSNLFTFTKLFILSGLQWIFGILAEGTGMGFFRYSFIIFVGLQGTMFCLAFFCRRICFRIQPVKRSNTKETIPQ